MKKPTPTKSKSALKAEVSPKAVIIIVAVLVVLFGGYFAMQKMRGPKVLTGNSGTLASSTEQQSHAHVDEYTGNTVNKD